MTETRMKEIVTQVIAEARIEPRKYYHVCWWEGKLQCRHVHHTKDVHTVFYSASGSVFADGLTGHQWRLLTGRLTDFCRTRGIKPGSGLPRGKGNRSTKRAADRPKITEFDSMRLRALLTCDESLGAPADSRLEKLQRLLESADTIPPQKMPGDVVTMNSQVQLWNGDSAGEVTLSLVFPAAACGSDLGTTRLSILTHTGLSLLGRKVGDVIAGGIRIDNVLYQPEAAGDLHL